MITAINMNMNDTFELYSDDYNAFETYYTQHQPISEDSNSINIVNFFSVLLSFFFLINPRYQLNIYDYFTNQIFSFLFSHSHSNYNHTDTVQPNKQHKISYEDKYLDKYKKLARSKLTKHKLDSLINNYMFEFTPAGNLIMNYDTNNDTFQYYSDNTIPYRYLNSAAKKYVTINHCKDIYKDTDNLQEEQLTEELTDIVKEQNTNSQQASTLTNNTTTIENKRKNVFANFKKYNKETTIPIHNPSSHKPSEKPNNKINSKDVKKNINTYKNNGRISNFSFINKQKINASSENSRLTFADFKKLSMK